MARSLLAFWMGGASSTTPTGTQGKRSLLAHWMGGASSTASVSTQGYRSLFAFWSGGASGTGYAAITPVNEEYQGGFWSDGTKNGTWARKKRHDEDHAQEIVAEAIDEVIEDIPEQITPYVAKKLNKTAIAGIKKQAMAIALNEQSEQYAQQQVVKLLQEIDEEEALIMLLL